MVCPITRSPLLSFASGDVCGVEMPTFYDTGTDCNLIAKATFVSLQSACVISRKLQSKGALT